MTIVSAKKRETKTTGDINKLRLEGFIPGVLYGGREQNHKIRLTFKDAASLPLALSMALEQKHIKLKN